jgi:hypothetical protein
MNSTECTQFMEILGQQPDGPWPQVALAHVDSCPPCRELWQELDAIRAAGRELGSSEPEPPEHLWALLRDQLQSEGLIREPQRPGWFTEWFGFSPRFAMGGAYVALLAVAGSLAVLHNDRPSAMKLDAVHPSLSMPGVSTPSGSLTSELNQTLDGDIERVVASLSKENAPLATSVRQNLGVVDNLIVLCEKSVRENPDNPVAREYLYGAYQQKATLLEAAMDRTTLENR